MSTSGGPWTINGQTYNYRTAQQTANGSLAESGNPYAFSVHAADNADGTGTFNGTANVDNTGPAIARVVIADATNNTAGYFKQGGGYFVYAQVTDVGSGVATVTGDVSNITSGATAVALNNGGSWTIGGQTYNHRSSQQTANATVLELTNPYAFTVGAVDNLNNSSSLGGSANVDNTAASVARVAVANATNYAAVIKQGGAYYVYAQLTDSGSGVGAVTGNVSNVTTGAMAVALSNGSWTIGGQTYNYRSAVQTAKNPLPESGNPYSFTVTGTDNVGNASAAFGGTVNVDNTAATATDVQATNDSAGAIGLAQQNDKITFTFSEQMDPDSIKTGWNGSATTVTVRLDRSTGSSAVLLTVWDSANTTQIATLGSVSLVRSDYISTGGSTRRVNFTSSSMVQSGSTIAITLGAAAGPDTAGTAAAASTMIWTPSTAPKDLAGNAMSGTTVNETTIIVTDKEF
jgi:hypothetical protein